jgi:hypothetical protein
LKKVSGTLEGHVFSMFQQGAKVPDTFFNGLPKEKATE